MILLIDVAAIVLLLGGVIGYRMGRTDQHLDYLVEQMINYLDERKAVQREETTASELATELRAAIAVLDHATATIKAENPGGLQLIKISNQEQVQALMLRAADELDRLGALAGEEK